MAEGYSEPMVAIVPFWCDNQSQQIRREIELTGFRDRLTARMHNSVPNQTNAPFVQVGQEEDIKYSTEA